MRICIVGSGYVGLVTGTCLADSGNRVIGVDIDEKKVELLSRGECPIYEPGLEEMLRANLKSSRQRFSTDLAESVRDSTIVFIAVGTPPRDDGSADLTGVESVAAAIAAAVGGPTVIVVKSTVPVGTCDRLAAAIERGASHPINVVSNPEFLKEGCAVDDFLRPDRVVIGADDDDAAEIITDLYRPFVMNNRPILRMSRSAAEMTKYAANACLATRISFINEIAAICDRMQVDINEVRRGIGSDSRIGNHFLYPGVGYGGSCFPKDVQALAHVGRAAGVDCGILEAVHRRNVSQHRILVDKILEKFGPKLDGRRFAFWGVAFKPKTDDIREAPSLSIAAALLDAGAEIALHDPQALQTARAHFGERVAYCDDAYDAIRGADALVIVTEWNEFRNPDFDLIRERLKQPLIFDGRNIYDLSVMSRRGFEYHSIGRPPVVP